MFISMKTKTDKYAIGRSPLIDSDTQIRNRKETTAT